jgi:hypothetical protein
MSPTPHEIEYVNWQNRATRFYAAARLCYQNGLPAPASYSGVIALELLLKATLAYHDRSIRPSDLRHRFASPTSAEAERGITATRPTPTATSFIRTVAGMASGPSAPDGSARSNGGG